jgi:hypothetical protein
MKMQSQTEVLRVVRDWAELYAPSNLIKDKRTAELLVDWVIKNDGEIVSFSGLNNAVAALGSQVLTPEPSRAELQAAADAKAEARQRRDWLDSIKPQPSFEARVKADADKRAKESAAKAQKDAAGLIQLAIEGYQCYRINGGGVDYGATEMVRQDLRTIRFGDDNILTLEAVKAVILELEDHPTLGSATRAVERVNARLNSLKK